MGASFAQKIAAPNGSSPVVEPSSSLHGSGGWHALAVLSVSMLVGLRGMLETMAGARRRRLVRKDGKPGRRARRSLTPPRGKGFPLEEVR